jgi:flagellar basal body rod protein FlgB
VTPAAELAPVIEAPPLPAPKPPAAAPVAAPAPAAEAPPVAHAAVETPEVKHVKVRSSVDVMAELDALRKKATQGTTKKSATSALDALSALGASAKKSTKTIAIKAEGAATSNTRRVRITVQMEDGDRNALQIEEQIVELQDTAEPYQVNLKIDFGTAR